VNLAEGVQFVSLVILGIGMIVAAVGVVLMANIVYSAFLLAMVFVCMSGLYLLLNADFVAAAQILIYVGAINVLILFAIMLVNKQENFKASPNLLLRQVSTALVCFGLLALLGTMVLSTPWAITTEVPQTATSTIVLLGKHFFSDFLLPFELASVFLLMAMVGAIILARRDYLPDIKGTNQPEPDALTLPERPRELATIGTESKGQDS
jgi:NAD(P)H-quinone oxidoreductase subunit 6